MVWILVDALYKSELILKKIISASEYNMAKFHYFYTVCTKQSI